MQAQKRPYLLLVNLIGVLLFVCSCGSLPGSPASHLDGQSMTAATATPTPSPTPIPPVFTSCPATGTARAAVMPPLPAGGHQAVLYTSDRTSGTPATGTVTSILKRYDPTTDQQADVLKVTVPQKLQNNQTLSRAIDAARISDNGQWIVFLTSVEGKQAIQLVRADGQELQTLYCTTTDKDLWSTLSFSPDTRYVTFDELPISSAMDQNLVLLDLATGTLHVMATASGQGYALYEPIKWRDNSSLYVSYSRIGVDFTRNRTQVYLIPNVTQDSNMQQISVPTIAGASGDSLKDIDFSPDHTQMLVSDSVGVLGEGGYEPTGPSTIETVPLTGGSPRVIHVSQRGVIYARFITNTEIWFVVGGVWKINTDGSGLTQLANTTTGFELHAYSSSMHFSHDGSMFAFVSTIYGSTPSTNITIGSIDGSNIHTLTFAGQLDPNLIGWTTI